MATPLLIENINARNFWLKVSKTESCWIWTGANTGRYPVFRVGDGNAQATQVALILSGKPKPEAPCNHALHSSECITKLCVNPEHLRWGTHIENMQDARARGEHVRGTKQHLAVLDENKVREIRSMSGSYAEISRAFNVHPKTIAMVKNGVTWRHID